MTVANQLGLLNVPDYTSDFWITMITKYPLYLVSFGSPLGSTIKVTSYTPYCCKYHESGSKIYDKEEHCMHSVALDTTYIPAQRESPPEG